MIPLLCLLFLVNPIINSKEVLIYPLTLHKSTIGFNTEEYFSLSMRFQDTWKDVRVSLFPCGILSGIDNPRNIIGDVRDKFNNIYPDKPTTGYVSKGIFNVTNSGKDEIQLNFFYNQSVIYPILGLGRGIKYIYPDLQDLYEVDYLSQLIRKKVIDKYYIYLTPFFDIKGNPRNDASLELGRLPIYFDDKYKFSYTPLYLDDIYTTTKWATKLSHIFVGDINSDNMHEINANVIFTDSYRENSYIPEKLRTFFRTIFIDKMECEFSYSYIICPINKIEATKIYFVFNGYAHFIPSSLLFLKAGNDTHRYCSFKFSSEIDYIFIDSRIFGAYHRLYDGENKTIRFVYPEDPDFIVDVKDYTGFKNREGVKKEIPSIDHLRDWEQNLKKEELTIKESLAEIEKERNKIRERIKEIDKKEETIGNKEKIETLERENQELTEKVKKNKDLIEHLIKYCNSTSHP